MCSEGPRNPETPFTNTYQLEDEITYAYPNFNGSTVEVWEWIINFIQHYMVHMFI